MKAKSKILIGGGIVAAVTGIFFWVKKAAAAPWPPPSPPPDKSTLYGVVTDEVTGAPIEGIVASLDALYTRTTDANGRYQFLEIGPGTYTSLVFTDPLNRYETLVY